METAGIPVALVALVPKQELGNQRKVRMRRLNKAFFLIFILLTQPSPAGEGAFFLT